MDVTGAVTFDGEFEPAMGGEIDLLCAGNGSFVEDIVGLAVFVGRLIGDHAKIGIAIFGEMLTLKFGEETGCIMTDFVVVGVDVAAVKGEMRMANDFVGEAGIRYRGFVEDKAGEIFEWGIFGDIARLDAMEGGESTRERLGVAVAIFDSEVDEFRFYGDQIGSGAGETALADVFGEVETSDEGKKSAHDVGIGVHMRGEFMIINFVVKMLLNVGSDLIEGVIDVHLRYYSTWC